MTKKTYRLVNTVVAGFLLMGKMTQQKKTRFSRSLAPLMLWLCSVHGGDMVKLIARKYALQRLSCQCSYVILKVLNYRIAKSVKHHLKIQNINLAKMHTKYRKSMEIVIRK